MQHRSNCLLFWIYPAGQNSFLVAGLHQASPTNIASYHHINDLNLIQSARLLVGATGSVVLRRGRYSSNALLPTAEEVIDNLQSLVLMDYADGDFCEPFDVVGRPGVFTDRFVQLFLFSIVNNFANLEGTPAKFIIKFINQHEPVRSGILRNLRNGASTIYSRALAEKLLEAAIKAGDARTVHDLLALQIVGPDDIVCVDCELHQGERRMTAIEQASTLRQFDIMRLLLRFGADVNKTYKDPRSDHEK
jgi:hypothetical protein